MKDYTVIAAAGTVLVVILDSVFKTYLLRRRTFWIFWAILTVLMIIVNGWLTWRPIVIYNELKMTGFRIFTIPAEDFFFGFSLLGLNLIIWEYINKKRKEKTNG